MDPNKYNYYYLRARRGTITPEEIEEVRAELQNPEHKGKLRTLLLALETHSWVHKVQMHMDVMEPFLKGPDVGLASFVLMTLCAVYGLTSEYTREVLEFMKGVPWDPGNEVRGTAISVVGFYLNRASNLELLRELTHIAEHNTGAYLRTRAYDALYEALGHAGPPHGPRDPILKIDYEREGPLLIQEAKERLAREEAANREKAE